MKKIGALEAGGTKMVAAILTEDGKILDRISIPTRSPNETLPELIRFYQAAGVAALGIGSFGPVDLKQGTAASSARAAPSSSRRLKNKALTSSDGVR